MNDTTNSNDRLIKPIKIQAIPAFESEATSETSRKAEASKEWKEKREAVTKLSKEGNWEEVLNILKALSSKFKNVEIYKALAQRVWVGLKTQAPVTEPVIALFHLLNTLGPKHELAGPIAALAHLVAKHRTPDHPDRALAQGQAQQMFDLVCKTAGVENKPAFDKWVKLNKLDDPDHYIPLVMTGLEHMVGDDWWIDREALQKSVDEAHAAEEASS
ncbi:MAG: hypothetical protein HQL52_09845 [Magnetococcales bacterium]|nr:hypothetical protein [Magnetococcales bacterium]